MLILSAMHKCADLYQYNYADLIRKYADIYNYTQVYTPKSPSIYLSGQAGFAVGALLVKPIAGMGTSYHSCLSRVLCI